MADDGSESRKNKGANLGEVPRRLSNLEKAIAELSSPIVDCAFCAGSGNEPGADGKPRVDDNDRFVPCTVCKGRGKVRII